jgi:hypothetical protein
MLLSQQFNIVEHVVSLESYLLTEQDGGHGLQMVHVQKAEEHHGPCHAW